jgi:hypothetical protein
VWSSLESKRDSRFEDRADMRHHMLCLYRQPCGGMMRKLAGDPVGMAGEQAIDKADTVGNVKAKTETNQT